MVKQIEFQVNQNVYESLPGIVHKVSETKYLAEIPNRDLKVLKQPLAKETKNSTVQTLDQQIVILVNNEILNPRIPNGVYTWIMYLIHHNDRKKNYIGRIIGRDKSGTEDIPVIIFSPVETLVEFSNKHNNMNFIAWKRKLIPTKVSFDEMGVKKRKTSILYAGECLKTRKSLTFNFMSGSYSLKIKQSLPQNQKHQLQTREWFPSLKQNLKTLNFPIGKVNGRVTNWTINYSTKNFVNWKYVKFKKENYIILQPHRKSRFVMGTKENIKNLRTTINKYISDLQSFPRFKRIMDRIQKDNKLQPPSMPENLNSLLDFIDEMPESKKKNPKETAIKSNYFLRSSKKRKFTDIEEDG